jgi:hypothetical protein
VALYEIAFTAKPSLTGTHWRKERFSGFAQFSGAQTSSVTGTNRPTSNRQSMFALHGYNRHQLVPLLRAHLQPRNLLSINSMLSSGAPREARKPV